MGTGTSGNGQAISMNNAPIDTTAGGTIGQGTGMNAHGQGLKHKVNLVFDCCRLRLASSNHEVFSEFGEVEDNAKYSY